MRVSIAAIPPRPAPYYCCSHAACGAFARGNSPTPDADRFSAGLIPTADDIEGYRHDQSSRLAASANCIRCDKNVAVSNISHSIRGILPSDVGWAKAHADRRQTFNKLDRVRRAHAEESRDWPAWARRAQWSGWRLRPWMRAHSASKTRVNALIAHPTVSPAHAQRRCRHRTGCAESAGGLACGRWSKPPPRVKAAGSVLRTRIAEKRPSRCSNNPAYSDRSDQRCKFLPHLIRSSTCRRA